jgi:response regulator RpfG family c-di-GMP phosphodiesterase
MRSRFKIIHIVIILCLLFVSGCSYQLSGKKQPLAKTGIIDLRNWDFEKDGIVVLNGEWKFFWKYLLIPEDVLPNTIPESTGHYDFPGIWNDYEIHGEKISGNGYATFVLTILHNSLEERLAFEIGDMSSAYTLFVDGRKISSNGVVGKSKDTMIPEYKPAIVHFIPLKNQSQIILQISNFNHRKGGPWNHIRLGVEKQIQGEQANILFFNIFLIGSIFIMGLYHLGLFLLRRKFESPLYFSMFCVLIFLRSLLINERYLHILFPEISWAILLKMEYLSFYFSLPILAMFIVSLFPKEFSIKVLRLIQAIALIFSSIVIVSPASIFSHTVQAYQVFTVLACLYLFYVFLLAYRQHREGVRVMLIGSIFLFLSVVYDILQANELVQTASFLPMGMFIFILSQAFLLSIRFSKALDRVEKQKGRLLKINIAYKNEISERKKLEINLVESHQKFQNSRIALILGLAKLAEYRDEDTGSHLERIREYTRILAKELSKQTQYEQYISDDYINDIYQSSILHDIGKVGIRDSILLKPGKLTEKEFEIIKGHTVIGGDAISAIESQIKVRSFLTLARDIAYSHHEKWDGSGYPKGLKGDAIPLSARITAVADVYDALTSERPYKKAFSHQKAMGIITNGSGKHFDPNIIEAFCIQAGQFEKIQKNISD